jgi:hypothetical protein
MSFILNKLALDARSELASRIETGVDGGFPDLNKFRDALLNEYHFDQAEAWKSGEVSIAPIGFQVLLNIVDPHRKLKSISDLYDKLRQELENLESILAGKAEGDARKAMEFCLHFANEVLFDNDDPLSRFVA